MDILKNLLDAKIFEMLIVLILIRGVFFIGFDLEEIIMREKLKK